MESRLLLLSAVLWAGRVSCFNILDATAECCANFNNKWQDYGACVNKYGFVPVCDGSMRGCYYGNRFYKVGEVVQLIPSKCMMLVCSSFTVNSKVPRSFGEGKGENGQMVAYNTETVQVKTVQVSSECGCCEHERMLHPDGSVINMNRFMCDPKVCVDGKWVDDESYNNNPHPDHVQRIEDASNENNRAAPADCCLHYGQYYAHGEVISAYNMSYGSNCYKLTCDNGNVHTKNYDCCCIEDGEMYPCFSSLPLPSSDHETCHIRKCCDGNIETHHEPGCCFYNGQVYKPDQEIGYTSDYCQRKMCRGGVVVEEDAGSCCYVNGVYYRNNDVVEQNVDKCFLKLCINRTVEDHSLDHCPCCIHNNTLYRNGSAIIPSPCQALVCEEGVWVPDCNQSTCDYCYVGSHFRTFDDTSYHYNPPCNYTLVQGGYSQYPSYSTISLSFKKCSSPFTSDLTCPDVLTIKHNLNLVVTLCPGGSIAVNGNPVTSLPYIGSNDNGLFIYETAFAFNVITFSDLVVEYGKGYNPSVRILTSTDNSNYLYGLCGAYNQNSTGDLQLGSSNTTATTISDFVNSWETQESSCIGDDFGETNCSAISSDELGEIANWCLDLFANHSCQNVSLNANDFSIACTMYMCSCLPCMDYDCKTYVISQYAIDCANLGGIIDLECNEETTPSLTTILTTDASGGPGTTVPTTDASGGPGTTVPTTAASGMPGDNPNPTTAASGMPGDNPNPTTAASGMPGDNPNPTTDVSGNAAVTIPVSGQPAVI